MIITIRKNKPSQSIMVFITWLVLIPQLEVGEPINYGWSIDIYQNCLVVSLASQPKLRGGITLGLHGATIKVYIV